MKQRHRFLVALIVLGLLMTGPFVVTALVFWLDLKESEHAAATALIGPRLPLGTVLTAVGFLFGVGAVRWLFVNLSLIHI